MTHGDKRIAEQAAEIKELLSVLKDYDDDAARIFDEDCGHGQVHCTCVPALRKRIAELDRCRKFAVEVAQSLWDQEEPDGCDLQDMLEKHGIIEGHEPDPVEDADFIDEWGDDSKVYKLVPSLREPDHEDA